MGIHTGEALVSEEGYVGMSVHRAARISGAAHGGQVLVSQVVHELVGGAVPHDLGEHRLKDLGAPERLYQLGEEMFPPLRSLDARERICRCNRRGSSGGHESLRKRWRCCARTMCGC